jgi:hypothetical protein
MNITCIQRGQAVPLNSTRYMMRARRGERWGRAAGLEIFVIKQDELDINDLVYVYSCTTRKVDF